MSATTYLNGKYDEDVDWLSHELIEIFFEYDGTLGELITISSPHSYWQPVQEMEIDPTRELAKLAVRVEKMDVSDGYLRKKQRHARWAIAKLLKMLESGKCVTIERSWVEPTPV